jgi:hypothetical protein
MTMTPSPAPKDWNPTTVPSGEVTDPLVIAALLIPRRPFAFALCGPFGRVPQHRVVLLRARCAASLRTVYAMGPTIKGSGSEIRVRCCDSDLAQQIAPARSVRVVSREALHRRAQTVLVQR